MEMSPRSADSHQVYIKRKHIHKIRDSDNEEQSVISSKLRQINSMQSTVTPEEFINPFSTINIENPPISKTSEDLLPSRRICRIILIIGVIIAILTSIVAIILVVKYRT